MSAYHWIKHWRTWFTSASHADVDFDALHLGAFLMHEAKASPVPPWILNADGTPKSARQLATRARMRGTPRAIEKRMATALGQLVKAGTLVVRSDGAYGFTDGGWRDYQGPAPPAARQRAWRERERNETRNGGETKSARERLADRDAPLPQRSEDQKIRDLNSSSSDPTSRARAETSERILSGAELEEDFQKRPKPPKW